MTKIYICQRLYTNWPFLFIVYFENVLDSDASLEMCLGVANQCDFNLTIWVNLQRLKKRSHLMVKACTFSVKDITCFGKQVGSKYGT